MPAISAPAAPNTPAAPSKPAPPAAAGSPAKSAPVQTGGSEPKPPALPTTKAPPSFYAELEGLDGDDAGNDITPPKPSETSKPTQVSKPPANKGEDAATKPAAQKNGDQPAEEVKPTTPAGLRTAYEGAKKRIKELEARIGEVEKPKTNGDDPERKALSSRIEQLEKDLDERETRIQLADFKSSREYHDRYVVPIQNAFEQAYAEIKDFSITDADGNERKITPEDFNAFTMQGTAEAVRSAKTFGDYGQEMLSLRRNILQLNENGRRAIEEARARGESLNKERAASAAQQKQWWQEDHQEAEAKYSQWAKPDETDPEEAKILERENRLADLAFGDNRSLPPRERVKLHAAIHNKARWFALQVHRNRKLQAQVKELETKLAEFQNSAPDNETTRRDRNETGAMSIDQEIEALDDRR